MNNRIRKVLVLGAGIAGLTAAKELSSSSISVVVLEARRRAGGRIWTRLFDGVPIDLGASWIHGIENNPLGELLHNAGAELLETDYENSSVFDEYGGRLETTLSKAVSKSASIAIFYALDFLARQEVEISNKQNPCSQESAQEISTTKIEFLERLNCNYGSSDTFELISQAALEAAAIMKEQSINSENYRYFSFEQALHLLLSIVEKQRKLSVREQAYLNSALNELRVVNACELASQSLRARIQSRYRFGGKDYLVAGGLERLITSLLEGLEIHYGENVVAIVQNPEEERTTAPITVHTDKGNWEADYVLSTLPLGVLKSGDIEFSPELSHQKLNALKKIDVGVLCKVVMKFPEIFWDRDVHMLDFAPSTIDALPFANIVNLAHYTGEPYLLGLAGGEAARRLENMPEEDIRILVLNLMRKCFRCSVNETIAPELIYRTNWSGDIFSRGCYSVIEPQTEQADFDESARPEGRLFFAGEATTFEHQGTVHGAYLSGIRAAKEIDMRLKSE